jgi:type IV pilus assembly protein PilA
MVQKLRERSGGQGGFTLVELLVVMLILGLLAAIAIPSFFNQRDKAKDADAKASVRTAQTAMETYATQEGGAYTGVADTDLVAIEETLTGADLSLPAAATDDTYTVQVESETGNLFQISRESSGVTTLDCGNTAGVPPTGFGQDGCPSDGNWGG